MNKPDILKYVYIRDRCLNTQKHMIKDTKTYF